MSTRRHDRGAVLIEFALIFPVILLVVIGGIDLGIAQLYQSKLNFAAESAARCRAIVSVACPDDPATRAYAVAAAPLPGITIVNFTVAMGPCGTSVSAAYIYNSMLLRAIPISVSVCYP